MISATINPSTRIGEVIVREPATVRKGLSKRLWARKKRSIVYNEKKKGIWNKWQLHLRNITWHTGLHSLRWQLQRALRAIESLCVLFLCLTFVTNCTQHREHSLLIECKTRSHRLSFYPTTFSEWKSLLE